jgi:hypothetical protein
MFLEGQSEADEHFLALDFGSLVAKKSLTEKSRP